MLFTERYSKIKDELDRMFHLPLIDQRIRLENYRFSNSHVKNFLTILKILAENKEALTAAQIVEKDNLSNSKKRRKSREDKYYRIINGNTESDDNSIRGLISRGLIVEKDPVMTSKPAKTYKLSIFGVFYAIHIFSEFYYNKSINPDHKSEIRNGEASQHYVDFIESDKVDSILTVMSENYSDMLPLIFGKWNFLQHTIKSRVNLLTDLAHSGGPSSFERDNEPLFNTRPLKSKGWLTKQGIYADEITMWFYGSLASRIDPIQFQKIISKDKDIFYWYSRYVSALSAANKMTSYRIRFFHYTLEGRHKQAKRILKAINKLQGVKQSWTNSYYSTHN